MSDTAQQAARDPFAEILGFVEGPGNACRAGSFIPTLSKERQEAIATAVAQINAGSRMTYMAIGKALVSWGFPGLPDAAGRHLAGRCSCPR